MNRLFLTLLLLISVCMMLQGQEFDRAKLDRFLNAVAENDRAMGSLSLFQDGREVYQRSLGFADLASKQKANALTRYRIGSISKTFTAALVLQQVEAGKLSLETKLGEFFPDVPRAEEITVEHLLRHQSGIYNFTDLPGYILSVTQPVTRQEAIKKIAEFESQFTPGSQSAYSNSNYVLLSYILEDVTGLSFADLVRTKIAQPCDLQRTGYGGKIAVGDNEAKSYKKMGEWVEEIETDMSIPAGAGAIVSTPTELNSFMTCLHGGDLISEKSLARMTEIMGDFGMGLFELPFHGKTAIGHTGGIDGFQSNAFYFPDDGLSIAYVGNGVDLSVNDLLIGVLSIYFGMDYTIPEMQTVTVAPEVLQRYTGVYASPDFPLDLTISVKDGQLFGQATGQGAFPLEPTGETTFRFSAAGINMSFDADNDELTFTQGGNTVTMRRGE